MDLSQGLGLCLAIQALAMLVPGQNHLLLLSISSSGAYARAMAVFGIASAGVVFSTVVVFSIWLGGEATSAIWFALLNLLGSAYLTYLGAQLTSSFWRLKLARPPNGTAIQFQNHAAAMYSTLPRIPFFSGFLVNISNPKSALFFASIFSATIPVAKTNPLGLIVAILAFFLNSILFHGIVAGFFSLPRIQSILSKWAIYIRLLAGLVFISFGLVSGLTALHNIVQMTA
ncbi:LysE family transporter [Sinorhizobium meliloti]|uniref:LysE family transporter n=1 Tax=Rhizobium meliloti TaxID=382 RepID=UPI000FD88EA8|nr:LysE family transporter [Sinorhizobium meliloti]RVM01812.1 hypothetical protein CN134_35945 [Sinorhizobium meliloti]RVO20575.1 hypothetical protein CN098_34775 [Sinorhizobium meliloti]